MFSRKCGCWPAGDKLRVAPPAHVRGGELLEPHFIYRPCDTLDILPKAQALQPTRGAVNFPLILTTAATVAMKPWTPIKSKRYRLVDAKLIDPKDGSYHDHVTLDIHEGRIYRVSRLIS